MKETMSQAAINRYLDMLDSELDFSRLASLPILVMKNRRKGHMYLSNRLEVKISKITIGGTEC